MELLKVDQCSLIRAKDFMIYLKSAYATDCGHPMQLRHKFFKNLKIWTDVNDAAKYASPVSKIWEWGWIFRRLVKAISSPDVHSPWYMPYLVLRRICIKPLCFVCVVCILEILWEASE